MEEVNLITQRSNQNPTTKYNVVEEDPSSFFDGENEGSSSFDNETMSNAGGLKRMAKKFRANQQKRQARRDVLAQAKLEQAKSGTAMAKAQQESVKGDVALAKALEKSAPKSEKSKKSNTLLYVGIGVGVLVLGLGAYFMLKGKGKKGK
jgi:uncharacterized membrane protein